jgi:methylated-DNA-protein-cysteine methyltransferase related protein
MSVRRICFQVLDGCMAPSPYAQRVLDLVAAIPVGHVLAYSDVASILGEGGPRTVGTVMAKYGGGVPWHRVVKADGGLPTGHEGEAFARHVGEGTAMKGRKVDMMRARWTPVALAPPAPSGDLSGV